MYVLGLQGSPRNKGNTSFFLSAFLKEAENLGADTDVIEVDKKKILPCKEYTTCETKGFCPIKDDMDEIYPLLRKADGVVVATPIFFYSAPAQLKAFIDRCQLFWARKYRLNLTDPKRKFRRGFLLALGATRGKKLFDGMQLTAQYFFDAVGASFSGSLTYNGIEHPGDMEKHPAVLEDIKKAIPLFLAPFLKRKKVLFACRENACRSQMAGAFAQYHGGAHIDASSAGTEPADEINPLMVEVMAEKGIDMKFRKPQPVTGAGGAQSPEIYVTMGCGEKCPFTPGVQRLDWDLPDPAGRPIETMRAVRDEIEKKVQDLIRQINQ
ncbi:MAG: NAD(P)H-dependent oxidoreductase [Desulfobacterales bacterium]|nr:NAD(P)H-dependent oxidoreductase [Desulfobacterales bacterium]